MIIRMVFEIKESDFEYQLCYFLTFDLEQVDLNFQTPLVCKPGILSTNFTGFSKN